MARDATDGRPTEITEQRVREYLRQRGYPDAQVHSMVPLGQSSSQGLKSYGYGRPLRVRFASASAEHDIVLRTMAPDPFGHDRRSDRARVLLDAHDSARGLDRHVRPLDVGAFAEDGRLVAMARGEIFFVTEYVPGELYAKDIERLADRDRPDPLDLQRTEALADYLAELHRQAVPRELYRRDLRDTVGSGEGIFGLADAYEKDGNVAPAERLERIEHQAVRWRWKLRRLDERARRTHGDFHPFNILFREGTDFSLLDCSRGGAGEPADDLTALSINYLFFTLVRQGAFAGAPRALWSRFWRRYLERTGDGQVLEAAPLYFAWRALVLANPLWYPEVEDGVRDRLLRFVERLLDGKRFDPAKVEELVPSGEQSR